jgi:hypothetical protein
MPEGKGPLDKSYLAMGEGKGIQFTLWDNNLQLTRTEKNLQTGVWEEKQKFNLAPIVLKELLWKIPGMIETMEKIRKDRQEQERQA